jgi:membrane protease YdiL (CAAX protease family)
VTFCVVLVLIVIVVVVLVLDMVSGARRYAALAAAGLGVPALLVILRRVGREWSELNLMLALIRVSDEATARSLVRSYLAASMKSKGSSGETSSA